MTGTRSPAGVRLRSARHPLADGIVHLGAGTMRADPDKVSGAAHPRLVPRRLDDLGTDAARITERDGEPRPRAGSHR